MNKLEFPSHKNAWNWPSGSGEEDFKFCWYNSAILLLFPLRKRQSPTFEQTWIPITQGCFVLTWLKLAQWFWRRLFKNVSMYFPYFAIIFPWKREEPFIWKKTWIFFTERVVPSLLGIDPVVLEKKIFKFYQYILTPSLLSPLGKGYGWSFIWVNLNPLHPRMLCAKFGWNLPSGSGEKTHLPKDALPKELWMKLAHCFFN